MLTFKVWWIKKKIKIIHNNAEEQQYVLTQKEVNAVSSSVQIVTCHCGCFFMAFFQRTRSQVAAPVIGPSAKPQGLFILSMCHPSLFLMMSAFFKKPGLRLFFSSDAAFPCACLAVSKLVHAHFPLNVIITQLVIAVQPCPSLGRVSQSLKLFFKNTSYSMEQYFAISVNCYNDTTNIHYADHCLSCYFLILVLTGPSCFSTS